MLLYEKILDKLEKQEEILEKQEKILNEINKVIKCTPKDVSLSDLAKDLAKSNQTIHYHLTSNFEPEVDFFKRNGKIVINSNVVPLIKEYYEKKK